LHAKPGFAQIHHTRRNREFPTNQQVDNRLDGISGRAPKVVAHEAVRGPQGVGNLAWIQGLVQREVDSCMQRRVTSSMAS